LNFRDSENEGSMVGNRKLFKADEKGPKASLKPLIWRAMIKAMWAGRF